MELVNGIPSFIASAAALGLDLCLHQENLHIINGGIEVEEALKLSGTKVFLKSGKNLEKLRKALARDPELQVYSVKDCGFPTQAMYIGAENIPDGYMVVVIVKEREV
jgi:sirohydrochlorin cobaltochelatase/precorrin-2/cobalt-factor-2 C20-methyltransferase